MAHGHTPRTISILCSDLTTIRNHLSPWQSRNYICQCLGEARTTASTSTRTSATTASVNAGSAVKPSTSSGTDSEERILVHARLGIGRGGRQGAATDLADPLISSLRVFDLLARSFARPIDRRQRLRRMSVQFPMREPIGELVSRVFYRRRSHRKRHPPTGFRQRLEMYVDPGPGPRGGLVGRAEPLHLQDRRPRGTTKLHPGQSLVTRLGAARRPGSPGPPTDTGLVAPAPHRPLPPGHVTVALRRCRGSILQRAGAGCRRYARVPAPVPHSRARSLTSAARSAGWQGRPVRRVYGPSVSSRTRSCGSLARSARPFTLPTIAGLTEKTCRRPTRRRRRRAGRCTSGGRPGFHRR